MSPTICNVPVEVKIAPVDVAHQMSTDHVADTVPSTVSIAIDVFGVLNEPMDERFHVYPLLSAYA